MSETLRRVSVVLLFGRVVEDVELKAPSEKRAKAGKSASRAANRLVHKEMADADEDAQLNFARIYAFSYEGHYYDLAKPALFLVPGPGAEITASADHTGLPADDLEFASDIKVWSCDKSDISIRLDPESGTFEQILLAAELNAERAGVQYSGQGVRFAGQGVRFAGQGVRFAGQGVRFAGQGARLRGNRGSGGDE
jgi:hypothetical protein